MQAFIKVGIILTVGIAAVFMLSTHETQATAAGVNGAVSDGVTSPRSLYMQNCARCHGANGKAETALGKKLEADDLTASTASTAKVIRTITNGRGKMPSFRKKLTATQIKSVAEYVKTL